MNWNPSSQSNCLRAEESIWPILSLSVESNRLSGNRADLNHYQFLSKKNSQILYALWWCVFFAYISTFPSQNSKLACLSKLLNKFLCTFLVIHSCYVSTHLLYVTKGLLLVTVLLGRYAVSGGKLLPTFRVI